jgi:hypothetical protein
MEPVWGVIKKQLKPLPGTNALAAVFSALQGRDVIDTLRLACWTLISHLEGGDPHLTSPQLSITVKL